MNCGQCLLGISFSKATIDVNSSAPSSKSPIVMTLFPCRIAHLLRDGVGYVNAVYYSHYGRFDGHVLVPDGRTRSFAISTHHHFTSPRTKPVSNHNNISSWFFIQVVRMNNQKSDAFEIRCLLGGPDCAYDF